MSPASPELFTAIHVLVLSDLAEEAELLVSLLAQVEGLQVRSAPTAFGEGLKAVTRYDPHVVVVADTIENPAAVIEELDAAAPSTTWLAILPEGDVRGAQDCTLAGARATLLKPFDQERLVQAIRQVHARETRRKQHVASSLDAGAARQQRPRVIAVHGAKGGVGATTLACNLAAALRRLTGRRVALIDGDVLSGDARVMFDVNSAQSLADLLPQLRELDADLVDALLAEHGTGVRVLLAPDQLQRAEALTG
ncbi:MAG TPA: P-loop NTPase, partial [Candidatus Thermoplasmatota archaeon]|nr:P-loop NTPase [Candidatus Thermoplasmatota archaeon]